MNEKDLSQIETKLKVVLPEEYRALMLARTEELRDSGCFDGPLPAFYLTPGEVTSVNRIERPKDSGTGYAFPQWWQTFFLVGTDGAGNYYCLRLDNEPGVWMIGSDCGDTPTRVARSLKAFVDRLLHQHEEEQQRAAQRQERVQEEEAVEMEAALASGNPKAKDWLTAEMPDPMFDYLDNLGRKSSPRKLRLFGIACCRRLPDLDADDECARAVHLAERMVDGAASMEEVARLRTRLSSKHSAVLAGEEHSAAGLWTIGAATNLLEDDDDYLNDVSGDADLTRVWSSACSAVSRYSGGSGYMDEAQAQADLLRDVLGNPFVPVRFEPQWRTPEVIELAKVIYDEREYDRMGELADALADAGCDDPRILKHCEREGGHVRGCWVVDLILENEPEPVEEEFTWDFTCRHPTIDTADLKRRLQAFGADAEPDGGYDESAVLEFADWLESAGDPAWANYIRVRCALDGKAPGENYPDLVEECFERGAAMHSGIADFEGLYFSGYHFAEEEWWEDKTDDMERGLPSRVKAVRPGRGAGPAAQLIKRIEALVSNTPVRGIDFEWHYPDEMAEILNSSGARHLRWLAFANRPHGEEIGPAIKALTEAPLVHSLERLTIDEGIKSDADALALAGAPLERLRRLDLPSFAGIFCSPNAVVRLMTAPWFRELRQLRTGFSRDCCETGMLHLAGMPHLHTLAMYNPLDRQIGALARTGEFPALRRLFLQNANLSGKYCEAFCQLKAPRLIELWLRGAKAKTADIRALVATPIFDGLRALTFDGPRLNKTSLDLVARSPCATKLRILRLRCGGTFRSLAGTPLTKPDVFPALTTLEIKYPFAKQAQRDTAEFLHSLATPKLRHLTLIDCDFDDDCAEALASNPAFATLTRLKIEQGYHASEMLTPKAAKEMFLSANLQQLVELELDKFAVGDALEVLADESVMAKLQTASFCGSEASTQTIERLTTKRPMIYVGA